MGGNQRTDLGASSPVSDTQVATSVQRRRRWSRAEKERIVAAAIEPGAVASEVARRAGIHVNQLLRWRQQLCGVAQARGVRSPVVVAAEPGEASALSKPSGAIEIEFSTGARMRITGLVDASMIEALIAALAKIRRQ
jgi:transposase